jgi:hypothetical protein
MSQKKFFHAISHFYSPSPYSVFLPFLLFLVSLLKYFLSAMYHIEYLCGAICHTFEKFCRCDVSYENYFLVIHVILNENSFHMIHEFTPISMKNIQFFPFIFVLSFITSPKILSQCSVSHQLYFGVICCITRNFLLCDMPNILKFSQVLTSSFIIFFVIFSASQEDFLHAIDCLSHKVYIHVIHTVSHEINFHVIQNTFLTTFLVLQGTSQSLPWIFLSVFQGV